MTTAIEFKNVNFSFGQRSTLKDVSFKVNRGCVHGLLGPNGAGKTTTMKLLVNLLEPDSGEVVIDNECVDNFKHGNKIGFLLDNLPLYKEMTVFEFLLFLSKIRGILVDKQQTAIEYCLNVLDLNDVKDRLVGNLSKGYKQRVAIAQAIIHNPAIVILDEPTLGLDPQSVIEIRNLILKLKNDHTILVSSHLLYEMSLICDEITILNAGEVLQTGPLSELESKFNDSQVVEVIVGDVDITSFKEKLLGLSGISRVEHKTQQELNNFKINVDLSSCDLRPDISKLITDEGIALFKIDRSQKTLEDVFIGYTS